MHLFCWNRTQQSLVISTVNNFGSILARPILARVILARPILARDLRFSMEGRRRGGAVQRARAPKRPRLEVPEFGKSQLAYFLVREVVWGAMSPQLATKLATLALQDLALAKEKPHDFVFKDLEMLSNLPSTNTYRTLLDRLETPFFPA